MLLGAGVVAPNQLSERIDAAAACNLGLSFRKACEVGEHCRSALWRRASLCTHTIAKQPDKRLDGARPHDRRTMIHIP